MRGYKDGFRDTEIPLDYLRQCFRHVGGGEIVWADRPIEHFKAGRSWFDFRRNRRGRPAFTGRHKFGYGLCRVNFEGRNYALLQHRVVFALVHGRWPSMVIDHIDRNPRNNSPENLRDVSQAENLRNRA